MKMMKYPFLLYCFVLLFLSGSIWAQNKADVLQIPMNDGSKLTIDGPHRFMQIAGITGLHVTSLRTKAYFETNALQADRGAISVWMSPLENMDKFPALGLKSVFPFLSDYYPSDKVDSCNFSLYYAGSHYPRVIGRFTTGDFWQHMDYDVVPFVYAESLPLQKGQWYHVVMTWDKPKATLFMYINGELVGHNFQASKFMKPNKKIFVGNPLMVLCGLKIQTESMNKEEVSKEYLAMRPETNQPSEDLIRKMVIPQKKSALSIQLDDSWEKVYECSFSKKSDLDAWAFQTGDKFRDKFKLEIAENSLYWETPKTIDTETRSYLWCPAKVEGDQWVEFEFQLVSPKGLALVMMCASGMQGEDVIDDRGLLKTGSMSDMLMNYRNYHWEYVRRVDAMRTDVETQYLNKNPWGKDLYVGCVPRLEQNRWIKIRYIKIGNKIYGSFDGNKVFEVEDNAYINNGPVLNSGRVVLRQMYNTAMRYRNFVIYTRKVF